MNSELPIMMIIETSYRGWIRGLKILHVERIVQIHLHILKGNKTEFQRLEATYRKWRFDQARTENLFLITNQGVVLLCPHFVKRES